MAFLDRRFETRDDFALEASACDCGSGGRVHAAGCGCERAAEFMAAPLAQYHYSRRDLLTKALAGGVTLAALPLLHDEAEAQLFSKPSPQQQIQMGEQAAAQVLQKYPEVKDSRATEFNRVGQKLREALPPADRDTWHFSYRVVQSNELNAFALPGGPMFMFTGLMDRIKSSSELAAVTGHEMTHVRKQHWANAYANQQKRSLGLGVLLGVFHAGAVGQTIAGVGNQLYSLKFSRGEEDQADAGGLENMVAAGFNPHGMLDLFNTLQQASGGRSSNPAFLSDHPLTSERIRNTQKRIAKLEAQNPGLRNNG